MGRRSAVAALVVLIGGMTVLAGSAASQTGYPPGPCAATISAANIGNFNVGQTFTVTVTPTCAFTAGTPVTVTVNGVVIGTKVASIAGTVPVTVRIVSATVMEIDDPVQVPTICGLNAITAQGASSVAQATVTHTVNFGVTCPAPATRTGGIAFTGANILRMAGIAVVAIMVGSLLVTSVRKRRQRVPELV